MTSQADAAKAKLASAPWLTAPATQAVLAAIEAGGFEARVVGGAVRNTLMGVPVSDIDIATTARPHEVMRLAAAAGFATIATGLSHGTLTVLVDHHPFEVTTLRTDVASDGRHATVAFSSDWTADASRRDFTINALYCGADGTLYDPLDGIGDLMARRVRFIGDAGQRIAEDYLRILRFFRFTAQYSQAPADRNGLVACVRGRGGLARLSGERVRQELLRLLVAPGAFDAIETMRTHGILAEVLPVVPRPTVLRRLIEIETVSQGAADAVSRLAALGVASREEAERIADRLRLSTRERDGLLLAAHADAFQAGPPGAAGARAMLYRVGPNSYQALIKLAWARALPTGISDAAWTQALSLPTTWGAPRFPIKGADLLAAGMSPGPDVGHRLRELEMWWVAQDFTPDRAALLARLNW